MKAQPYDRPEREQSGSGSSGAQDVAGTTVGAEAVNRAERYLSAQYSVTRVLADATNLRDAASSLIKAVCDTTEWKIGALWIQAAETRELQCVEVWHVPGVQAAEFEVVSRGTTLIPGTGLPGRVWSSAKPIWMADVSQAPDFLRAEAARRAELHGAFAFPVRVRHRVLGVLEFFSTDLRDPDEQLLQLFDALGEQIGQFLERRDVEEARARLAAIVDSSDDAIVSKTLDGIIRSWNRGAERIFGYTAAEAVGRHISLIVPEHRRAEEEDVLARLRRGERIDHFETERRTKDGRILIISLTVSPVRNADGEIIGASKVGRDITERRRTERALRESEERYRRLVALLPAAVYTCEAPSGRITFYNDRAADLWGRAPRLGDPEERFCGSFRLWQPDGEHLPHAETPMAVALRDGREFRNQEVSIERPDGSRIIVLVNIDPIRDESGRIAGAINVFHDVTALKAAEQERQRLLRLAQEHAEAVENALQVRDEFLSLASHELRNPLNALQLQLVGLLRAGRDRGDTLPAAWVCDRLEQAVDDVGRLVRLVDNLLDVSRITSGRLDLDPEEVDLSGVIEAVVRRFEPQFVDGQLQWEPMKTVGCWDRLRLDQIVSNLVANAVKYGEGRPIIVSVQADAQTAVLTVADRGIGMSAEQQRHLFERFQRTRARRQYGGFGLGLWITKKIVDAMGGEIHVESRPGAGSTFRVHLPRQAVLRGQQEAMTVVPAAELTPPAHSLREGIS